MCRSQPDRPKVNLRIVGKPEVILEPPDYITTCASACEVVLSECGFCRFPDSDNPVSQDLAQPPEAGTLAAISILLLERAANALAIVYGIKDAGRDGHCGHSCTSWSRRIDLWLVF